jgi:hypothetical protein
VYEDGLRWGGLHKRRAVAMVGGSVYHHALQAAGLHAVALRSDNDAGATVGSGVYFYRYTVEPSDHGRKFSQTMKMIVLR